MASRALALSAALVVLVVPAVAADSTLLADAASNHPCSGSVDANCIHTDCTQTFCVRIRCLVYLGHSGHPNPLFGCTPP